MEVCSSAVMQELSDIIWLHFKLEFTVEKHVIFTADQKFEVIMIFIYFKKSLMLTRGEFYLM